MERKVVNRKLYSKRFLTKTNKLPKWGERFFPTSMTRNVFIVEETVVDPRKKTLTTYTRNIGLTTMMVRTDFFWRALSIINFVQRLCYLLCPLYSYIVSLLPLQLVEERCTYRQSPENKNWTVCDRHAWISSSMYGFSYALQAFGLDRFKKNVNKAVKGFEHVLNRMYVPETIPEHPMLQIKAEMFKEKAKKAKNLAKSKAASVVVAS